MTLGQFLDVLAQEPGVIAFYYVTLPLTAFIAGMLGKGSGHESPWKFLYTVLVYMACIPGIFSATLTIYLIVVEKQSVLDIHLFTQILPIVGMVFTLWVIRKNVAFDDIPGFDKLHGLILFLGVLISFLWILEKLRILVITYIPIGYFLLVFIIMLIVMRYGWKKMAGR